MKVQNISICCVLNFEVNLEPAMHLQHSQRIANGRLHEAFGQACPH